MIKKIKTNTIDAIFEEENDVLVLKEGQFRGQDYELIMPAQPEDDTPIYICRCEGIPLDFSTGLMPNPNSDGTFADSRIDLSSKTFREISKDKRAMDNFIYGIISLYKTGLQDEGDPKDEEGVYDTSTDLDASDKQELEEGEF